MMYRFNQANRANRTKRNLVLAAASFLMAVFLSSCIGVQSEITIKENGSGTISLEYRISGLMDSLGKLDGNEGMPPLPVGKADFERTIARVQGLKILSFSTASEGGDTLIRAKLEFSTIDALREFLGASVVRAGSGSRGEGGQNRLSLNFGGGSPEYGELSDFLRAACEGYNLAFIINLPGEARVSWSDGQGGVLASAPLGSLSVQRGRVSFSAPIYDLAVSPSPVIMELSW